MSILCPNVFLCKVAKSRASVWQIVSVIWVKWVILKVSTNWLTFDLYRYFSMSCIDEGQYIVKKNWPQIPFWHNFDQQVTFTSNNRSNIENKLFSDGSWRVIVNNPVDPFDVLPHFGVDAGVVWVSAADAPGHNTLKVIIADKRTPGVALWGHKK